MLVFSRWLAMCCATGLLVISGCASDEFSPTHDYSKKQTAPIPSAPAQPRGDHRGPPPPAPPGQGKTDPDAPKEFTSTPSGLKYRVLRKSNGRKPRPGDSVVTNYRGWLDSGKQFDASYGKRPFPFDVRPGGVIAGWVEGIQLIGEGGMVELELPPQLAYGAEGAGGGEIPPHATLHFIVELLQVK
jgi:hypothetical protein